MANLWERYILDDNSNLGRLKVPGGWLVRIVGYRELAICFYPDPLHKWKVGGEVDSRYTCLECGGHDLRKKTEFYKAFCHIQYLIDESTFCYDCQSDEIKNQLDNPIKSCDDCKGTPTCPNSEAAHSACNKNYSLDYIRQNDQRDDWPHAIIKQGCDCVNNA